MNRTAYLVLSDGTVYKGEGFGADISAVGEVVFTTSMTGYQEMLTDPSFLGQIVVGTYPLMGNYGFNGTDSESSKVQVSGFAVRNWSDTPSHALSEGTLDQYLAGHGIPGISGVDTRAITRRLRNKGVMMGTLTVGVDPQEALNRLNYQDHYDGMDFVQYSTTKFPYRWKNGVFSLDDNPNTESELRIVVTDYGVKYNILRILQRKGCEVIVVPADFPAERIMELNPQGVVLSPGPGDPSLLKYVVQTAKMLVRKVPVLGICLGHQVIAHVFGGTTYKLKFGHRGANHPVKDLATGKVSITAQNHGYTVDSDRLPHELDVSHVNLNDGTVEGLRHKSLPIITIQYHSEASPGPRDNEQIFDRFLELVRSD